VICIKKYFCAVLSLILFLTRTPVCCAETAVSYILTEAETGTVIESENADMRRSASYMSKLMSLLIVAEDIQEGKYKLSDEVTASDSVSGTEGSVIWLEKGDSISIEELVKSTVIGNANDAVTVLAENSRNSVKEFVKAMNEKAVGLGLKNTFFCSPYGYYNPREYTSAHDIAVICSELSRYSFLTPYFTTWRDFVKNDTVELVNENTLARTYDRHIGFKACHSENSGYCIAEGGKNDSGTVYIAVVLGAESEDISFSTAKKAVNRGFSDFKVTAVMFPDEMLMPLKVKNGTDFAVEIQLEQQELLVIPRGVSELKNVTVIPEYINAPVRRGQPIGTVGFYNGDTLVSEGRIVVKNDVEKLSFTYVLKQNLLNITK